MNYRRSNRSIKNVFDVFVVVLEFKILFKKILIVVIIHCALGIKQVCGIRTHRKRVTVTPKKILNNYLKFKNNLFKHVTKKNCIKSR